MYITKIERYGSPAFALLQRLGQALVVPVSVLPAAGLMVALGRICTDFTQDDTTLIYQFGKILYASGLVVFEQLSLIFAVGVSLGFTSSAGIAGLAAVTGYFAFTTVLKTSGDLLQLTSPINTGVFGGISVGFLVSFLYNRYHTVKLHPVLGFFSGKRLVPILSVLFSVLLAGIFVLVWPPIQNGIHEFGVSVMGSEFGPSIYASVKRLLIPVGLHHVFYPSFLYEFGEFTNTAGTVVHGEASRYFAGDPSAGRFMASEFPIMLFGLPAAALAMTLRARPERRKAIAGVMLTAALTSIVTGITEPIEFAYTFVAPPLYLAHAALTFLSGYLTSLFDIHLGYTFSASIIDMALGFFNQHHAAYLLIVGPLIGAAYFTVFYWAIGQFNFKTPGREDDADLRVAEESVALSAASSSLRARAVQVLAAIGGPSNIRTIDACITRLRLSLGDSKRIDRTALQQLGASGVMDAGGGNVQIVFGVESDFLKTEIQALLTEKTYEEKYVVHSPMHGTVVAIDEIPDPTFNSELMGKTIGMLPERSSNGKTMVIAPFDGKVAILFHTNHAIGLVSKDKIEMLIHVGIDTVKMNGKGYKAFVKGGDQVKKGQKLIEFDFDRILKEAPSIITPIVITNSAEFPKLTITAIPGTRIQEGDVLWKYS